MVHMPSAVVRTELLSVPEMPRLTLGKGEDGFEATLLIKASSLTLKYIVTAKSFQFALFPVNDREIGYAVKIDDDDEHPAVVWSIVRMKDELRALKVLVSQPKCTVFLFNEAAVNVAWASVDLDLSVSEAASLIGSACLSEGDLNHRPENLEQITLGLCSGSLTECSGVLIPDVVVESWNEIKSSYLTNAGGSSDLSIFSPDEGAQQEALALWLTDGLQPSGAVINSEIFLNGRKREFTDVLFSYQFGTFFIESKTLAIFSRPKLPNRHRLTLNIESHLRKATGQLAGALRAVRGGAEVTKDGQVVPLQIEVPPHVIVLVPDLTLLANSTEFGGHFIKGYMIEHRAFLHILDTTELVRMVQAAQMIASAGNSTTAMMGFDAHLVERFQRALGVSTPEFDFLLKIV